MGLSPAWFPISSKKIGGEPERPRGELHKLSFFGIIYTIYMILDYEF
jgi:hypothetical protein